MVKSSITIDVELDSERVPSNIRWQATESTANEPQNAKAMMLSFWDASDKSALRIDLWTQKNDGRRNGRFLLSNYDDHGRYI